MTTGFLKRYYPYLILALFSVPLFLINIRNTHCWGDDFSQYIKEAQNIATGRPYYQSNYIFNNLNKYYAPPEYPPGFPLLLAPVVKFWGIEIMPMLYLVSAIVAALLFALFAYFRKFVSPISALCLSLILVYSTTILDLKGSILSDVPCLLFIVLYLTLRNNKTLPFWKLPVLMCLGVMAVLIRSQGLTLLAAECVYFLLYLGRLIRERRFAAREIFGNYSLILIAGILVLYFVVNDLIFPAPSSTISYYSIFVNYESGYKLWKQIGTNANFLLGTLIELLTFKTNDAFWHAFVTIIQLSTLVFALMGFIYSVRNRKLRLDDLFFIIWYSALHFSMMQQGTRYLVGIFPMYLLYSHTSMKQVLPPLLKIKPQTLAVVLTVFYLILGYDTYHSFSYNDCPGCIPNPEVSTVFNYIKTHVGDNDIVVSGHPRALTLYTNKRSIVFGDQSTFEQNKSRFDSLGVKYVLAFDDNNGALLRYYMREKEHIVDSEKINDAAVLYRIR